MERLDSWSFLGFLWGLECTVDILHCLFIGSICLHPRWKLLSKAYICPASTFPCWLTLHGTPVGSLVSVSEQGEGFQRGLEREKVMSEVMKTPSSKHLQEDEVREYHNRNNKWLCVVNVASTWGLTWWHHTRSSSFSPSQPTSMQVTENKLRECQWPSLLETWHDVTKNKRLSKGPNLISNGTSTALRKYTVIHQKVRLCWKSVWGISSLPPNPSPFPPHKASSPNNFLWRV